MAVLQRFLAIVSGVRSEVVPTTVGGATYAGQIVALDATTGLLNLSMLPPSIYPDVQSLPASEAIAANGLVNVWSNSGTASVRNADNTAVGKQAHGYTPAALASGATGTIYLSGILSGLTGLTPGTTMYLGTTGALTATAPTTPGNVLQVVGEALTATTVQFQPDPMPTTRA